MRTISMVLSFLLDVGGWDSGADKTIEKRKREAVREHMMARLQPSGFSEDGEGSYAAILRRAVR